LSDSQKNQVFLILERKLIDLSIAEQGFGLSSFQFWAYNDHSLKEKSIAFSKSNILIL
jgi:hypothetical protein